MTSYNVNITEYVAKIVLHPIGYVRLNNMLKKKKNVQPVKLGFKYKIFTC